MKEKFDPIRLYDNANKMVDAFRCGLLPLSKETGLPPLALEILLFVAEHREFAAANEICRLRGLKPGIVSVHIERLAEEGLVQRQPMEKDRRKTKLSVTERGEEIAKKGREVQRAFEKKLIEGIEQEDTEALFRILHRLEENIGALRKNGCLAEERTGQKEEV